MNEAVVIEATGRRNVGGVRVVPYKNGVPGATGTDHHCDLLAMSGGQNPVLHLFAQSGGKARWDDEKACFVPDKEAQPAFNAGAANGDFPLDQDLSGGRAAAQARSEGLREGKECDRKCRYRRRPQLSNKK